MSSKIIYVSGITGFVGTNLKPYLIDKNYTIKGLSRSKKNLQYNDLSKTDLDQSEAFIHLAGKAHDLKNTSNPKDYFEVNTELTKQLYNKFLASNSKTFIYMSSVKAVADIADTVLTEETTPNPKTIYGKSKLEAEKYILENLPKDKQVFILRPCMIHGPGNKGNLNLLYAFVKKGIPFPLGLYQNQRSFLSIDNLNFVILEILKGNINQGTYNVSDSGTLSINELVKTIANADNKKMKIIKVPKWIINTLAKIGNLSPFLPLNTEKLQKLTENYVVDNTKLLNAINKPLPVSINKGVIKTIKNLN